MIQTETASSLLDEEANERSSFINIKYSEINMRLYQALGQQTIFESIGGSDPYFKKWQREIHPILCEIALQPDQINQLFKSVEKGGGRSLLGKAADAVGGAADKISDVWFNKFGGMLQNSGPVQAFDQKYEDLKSSIAAKHPDIAAKLAKYGEFAEKNPTLHKFLLALGSSVAAALGVAVAGGVGAGALAVGTGSGVAVGILNIADRLLQGQKASSAIGRGATTGAVAGLAAGVMSGLANMVKGGIQEQLFAKIGDMRITNSSFDYNGLNTFAVTKPPETQMLSQAFRAIDISNPTDQQINAFLSILQKVNSPEYQAEIAQTKEIANAAKQAAKSSIKLINDLTSVGAAAAGGAASAASKNVKESLSRRQINELFGFTGNKIDASKLEKAWKKSGSPTDSEDIKNILQSAGVDDNIISAAFQEIGIGDAQSEPININDIVARIKKLTPEKQKEIINLLQA